MSILGTGYSAGNDNRISIQNQDDLKKILNYLDNYIISGTSSDYSYSYTVYKYSSSYQRSSATCYSLQDALQNMSTNGLRYITKGLGNLTNQQVYKYTSPSTKDQYEASYIVDTRLNNINTELGKLIDEVINFKQSKLSLIQINSNTTLLDLIYPIGSLYWSSSNTSPATLFGGTWVQIKDKFILAAGDTYTQGSTGGANQYSLTENNIPQHNHSFTPSGSISSHTHSFTPAGTVANHNHSFTPSGTVANHSHSFTPAGSVSSHDHSFSGSQAHSHRLQVYNGGQQKISNVYAGSLVASNMGAGRDKKYAYAPWYESGSEHTNPTYIEDTTVTISGTTGGTQPTFTGTAGTTGNNQPSFTGTAGTTGNKQPSFTGTAGTTGGTQPTFTGTASTTGNYGKSTVTAVSTMPPYEVYYCWKRTA